MRFAFFTLIVPDGHAASGFEIANDAILAGLRDLGHSVTVFGFRLPRQSADKLDDQVVLGIRELENAPAGIGRKAVWLAQALRHGLPYAAAKLVDYPAHLLDQAIVEKGPFDAYILNSYQIVAAFPQLLQKPHIYVAHNVEYRSALQNAEAATSHLQRFLYRRDARLLQPLEGKLVSGAKFVWTFSDDDAAEHGVQADRGCLLPLYIPGLGESKQSTQKQYDVGLIGTWSWEPNFLGLKWFVEEVVPKLPKTMRIAVAGSMPAKAPKPDPRVTLLGRVASAEGFLDSVQVVPLVSRGGTGVQLKTIEAFQAGRACVATSSAVRGIDELPANCLLANSADEFAQALVSLINLEKSDSSPVGSGEIFQQRQRKAMLGGLQCGVAAVA